MQENAWRPGLCPGPCWGTCSAPPDPLAGGDGDGCPLPKNSSPALGPSGITCPRPLILEPAQAKILATALFFDVRVGIRVWPAILFWVYSYAGLSNFVRFGLIFWRIIHPYAR